MNIFEMINNFEQLVTSGNQEDSSDRIKFAGSRTRKQLVKDLQKAKDKYTKLRGSVEDKNKAMQDLSSVVDRDSKEMQAARADILKAYEILKNMDMVDSNEIQMHGKENDDIGYVKNKKVYRLETDDTGNVSLQPFKRKKSEKADSKKEESKDDIDDVADAADELLANLVE